MPKPAILPRFAAAGLFLGLLPASALWADDKPASDAYVDSLRNCQTRTDPAERLACFDAAAASIVSASDEGDLKIVDREAVRQTRRKLFGFSLPDLGIFGGDDDDDGDDATQSDEFDQLETTITKVRATSSNGYVITTAEGAVWQIDDVPRRLMSPKVGQPLEIRSGALTSYFLRINGQSGVKGRRVQ